jgi:hypothetical protein
MGFRLRARAQEILRKVKCVGVTPGGRRYESSLQSAFLVERRCHGAGVVVLDAVGLESPYEVDCYGRDLPAQVHLCLVRDRRFIQCRGGQNGIGLRDPVCRVRRRCRGAEVVYSGIEQNRKECFSHSHCASGPFPVERCGGSLCDDPAPDSGYGCDAQPSFWAWMYRRWRSGHYRLSVAVFDTPEEAGSRTGSLAPTSAMRFSLIMGTGVTHIGFLSSTVIVLPAKELSFLFLLGRRTGPGPARPCVSCPTRSILRLATVLRSVTHLDLDAPHFSGGPIPPGAGPERRQCRAVFNPPGTECHTYTFHILVRRDCGTQRLFARARGLRTHPTCHWPKAKNASLQSVRAHFSLYRCLTG